MKNTFKLDWRKTTYKLKYNKMHKKFKNIQKNKTQNYDNQTIKTNSLTTN